LKAILQVFIIVSLSFGTLFSSEIKRITLKKDEQKKILVKYGEVEKLFKFRWTLYVNKGLVILRSYDRVVAQNVLYTRHKNQSFRQELKTRGADNYTVPYILVMFKEFNYDKNEALFDLMISDKKEQIELKYLKNS